MKTLVLREVDGKFFTVDGHDLRVYPNKHEGEQSALMLASSEQNGKFVLATLSDKTYCVNPSILWSTPKSPTEWKNQNWKQGWYELWQMNGEKKYSMSGILLVLHTPELGPGMLKHVQFNLDGAPNCHTETNYAPIRAFKVSKPHFGDEQ